MLNKYTKLQLSKIILLFELLFRAEFLELLKALS